MSTPVNELRDFVTESRAKCAATGEFHGAFRFSVAQDIVADDVRVHGDIVREAYAAEQEDAEAERLLNDAMADGIKPDDTAKVQTALRLIQRSRKRDHAITEIAEAK